MAIVAASIRDPALQIVAGDRLRVELDQAARRYYYHGWQSWSLAAWGDPGRPLPVQKPYFLHPMQIDPAWAFHTRPHGSWLGAVEQEDGSVVLLGALGLDAHVELDGSALNGWYEAGSGDWLVARGEELQVFAAYADELRRRLGHGTHRLEGGVWCSWYSLYRDIDEQLLQSVFDGLGDLPFEVLQVDDGWQQAIGDWLPNSGFPSGMEAMAERIKATGRRAGLWLAPLIAVRSSRLFRDHPDWFLRDERGRLVSAGFNWGEQLYGLDTTQPPVQDWLVQLMRRVRGWGFDYLKLDFLYGAGLPAVRSRPATREAALREGLQVLRDAMGADAFFLACGAPILPALGLCDALRVGPDVSSSWESNRDARLLHNPAIPGGRSAVRTTVNRLWLQPLVIPDPDVAYFRTYDCGLTAEQKQLLQALAVICEFRATSDLPQWLSAPERKQLHSFLGARPRIARLGPRRFRIDGQELDYDSAAELEQTGGAWNAIAGAAFGWLANHAWAVRLDEFMRRGGARKRRRSLHRQIAAAPPGPPARIR